jgi:NAD(P)-dependent dehydrogenase (short-subunit alcohol dehydrogenase family)
MPIYQLRTYHLATPEAVRDYLPRWAAHVASLREFGVTTHTFGEAPESPATVVALVSFDDDADPDAVIRRYVTSDGFAADMAGFDMKQIQRVETTLLGDTTVAARTHSAPGRLAGKVALITGAGRGQGAAEARLFAAEGAQVYVADVLEEQGRAVATEIRRHGGRARFTPLDVTDAGQWDRVVREIEDEAGRLDVLVNNAGINIRHDLTGTTEDEWARILDVNLTGEYLGIKACAPLLTRAEGGSVVNVGSTAAIMGHPVAAYSSSKWAVRGLTKSAAIELAHHGVRVNALHPGVVETPMMDATSPIFEHLTRLTPLGRAATPEEIASAALFLASADAGYVTGIDLPVDGGFSELATYNDVWNRGAGGAQNGSGSAAAVRAS